MTTPLATATNRRKRLIRWFLEGLLLLLALYLIHLWQTWDSVKGEAPALSSTTLTGETFTLERQRQKPLLIYFWATWCPVCKLSSDSIDKLSQQHDVITVAMQSGNESELRGYLLSQDLNFPVISDPDSQIANSWRVKGVPTIYIVDKENKIRSTTVGFTTWLGLKARMWLTDS